MFYRHADEGPEGRAGDTMEIGHPSARGKWSLEFTARDSDGCFPLEPGRPVVVGAGSGVDLRIDDPAVSSRHCEILCREHAVEVRDLGSKNGVFVGAARIGSTALLREDGASFVIGRTTLTLRHEDETRAARVDAPSVPGLIGTSAPMRRVAEQIRRYAASRVPVLLQGESGTGKDVVARALHTLSGRSGAYVPLNVNAFPESLADSELFGHRRGAYTGAAANRCGAFEQAHRGTLFLDEIADLAASIQAKLLRVVEDGVVRPMGAPQSTTVDVRIVSASWARLDERVELGRFRTDLFHRLAAVTIELPPLRKRKGDIAALSRSLLYRMRADIGERVLSSQALARLEEHDWPGNVRELGSVLCRAALASQGEEILAHHVDLPVLERRSPAEVLDAARAALLLAEHGGNVSRAARAAKVPRSTFRGWLSKSPRRAD
jgi:DNA-binding NtrC family response regulator